MKNRFVGLGMNGARVYLHLDRQLTKRFRQVLWGDFLHVDRDLGDVLQVIWAPKSQTKRQVAFISKSETSTTRPLEIVFVDVGQGDGAVLITPERDRSERIVVIDAGERDNMGNFLDARFGAYETGFNFHAAVITHPDRDHYLGFKKLFESENVGFDVVYHNGLLERPVSGTFEKLGGVTPKDKDTKVRYLKTLTQSSADVRKIYAKSKDMGDFLFPQVMQAAVRNKQVKSFGMLSTAHGTKVAGKTYVPGFGPSDPRDYTIEVLGPVVEFSKSGAPQLRQIGSYGETKNGHSVLLKLTIGDFRILFGGDLNEKAEKFLLAHYASVDRFPKEGSQAYREVVADASRVFRSDVMKVCHHGSEKVTDAFLESVNAAAFVISSGDEEGHVHPRPDLLGRLGRMGRGKAPVLLSTELQRSTRELEDERLVEQMQRDLAALAKKPNTEAAERMRKNIDLLGRTNVDVWGSVYVKTDGHRLITAFKKESGSDKDKWFYFEYEFGEDGLLTLVT